MTSLSALRVVRSLRRTSLRQRMSLRELKLFGNQMKEHRATMRGIRTSFGGREK